MTKSDFLKKCRKSVLNKTFISKKHDPSRLDQVQREYRTVISPDVKRDIEKHLSSENTTIKEYYNKDRPCFPLYLEVNLNNVHLTVASGVLPRTKKLDTVCDRLVVVAGPDQGLHIFGEKSAVIEQKVIEGTLIFKRDIVDR